MICATEGVIHMGCDGYTILRWFLDRFRWSWLLRHADWVDSTIIFSVKQSQKVRSSQKPLLGLFYYNTTPRRNVGSFTSRHGVTSQNTVRLEPNNLWLIYHYDQFDHSNRGHCAVTGVCRVRKTVSDFSLGNVTRTVRIAALSYVWIEMNGIWVRALPGLTLLDLRTGPLCPMFCTKLEEPCSFSKVPDDIYTQFPGILRVQKEGIQMCVSEWSQSLTLTQNVVLRFPPHYHISYKWRYYSAPLYINVFWRFCVQ